MSDRAEDSWEPLLAIAQAAGDPWPALARAAALALSGDVEEPVSLGIWLLTDLRTVFDDAAKASSKTSGQTWDTPPYMSTSDTLAALHLTARYLARLLRPYGVKAGHWRIGDETMRGYLRVDLEDVWKRYCPPVGAPASGTSGTSGTDEPVEDDYPASAWDPVA